MLTLKTHNEFADAKFLETKPEDAGVFCDKCLYPMIYMDCTILTSIPPQRRVKCTKCDYTGYKII